MTVSLYLGTGCKSYRRLSRLGDGRRQVRPDRWHIIGAAIWLVGVAIIMDAPRTVAS